MEELHNALKEEVTETSGVEVIDLYPESEDEESYEDDGIGTVAAMAIGAGITVAGIAAVKYGKRAFNWLKRKFHKDDDFDDLEEEIHEDDELEELPETKTK